MDIDKDLEQSETGLDSLDSEIDALSKIIDTKDGAQKLDDFKLDSNVFPNDIQFDSTEDNKSEFVADDNLLYKEVLFGEKSAASSSQDITLAGLKEDQDQNLQLNDESETDQSPKHEECFSPATITTESENNENVIKNKEQSEQPCDEKSQNDSENSPVFVPKIKSVQTKTQPDSIEKLEDQQTSQTKQNDKSEISDQTDFICNKNLLQKGDGDLKLEQNLKTEIDSSLKIEDNNPAMDIVEQYAEVELDKQNSKVAEKKSGLDSDDESIISQSNITEDNFENKFSSEKFDCINNPDCIDNELDNQNVETDIQSLENSETMANIDFTESLNEEKSDVTVQCTKTSTEEKISENLQKVEVEKKNDPSDFSTQMKSNSEDLETKKTDQLSVSETIIDPKFIDETFPNDKTVKKLNEDLVENYTNIKSREESGNIKCLKDDVGSNLKYSENVECSSKNSLNIESKQEDVDEILICSMNIESTENDSLPEQIFNCSNDESEKDPLDFPASDTSEKEAHQIISSRDVNKAISQSLESEDLPKSPKNSLVGSSTEIIDEDETVAKENVEELSLILESENISDEIEEEIEEENKQEPIENYLSDFQDLPQKNLTSNITVEKDVNKSVSLCDEIEKKLNSDTDELLKSHQNVESLIESEVPTLVDTGAISFDEESTSEQLLQPETEISETQSTEREDDISLVLEESSQSPKEVRSENFEKDVDHEYQSSDEVKFKKLDIIEEPKYENVVKSLEFPSELENNPQKENTQHHLDEATSKNIEESLTETSKFQSVDKFVREPEEKDDDLPIMEDSISVENPNVFVSMENLEDDDFVETNLKQSEEFSKPMEVSEAEIISEAAKLENECLEKVLEISDIKNMTEDDTMAREDYLPEITEISDRHEKLEIKDSTQDSLEVSCATEDDLLSLPKDSKITDQDLELNKKSEMNESFIDEKSDLTEKEILQKYESPERSIIKESKITDTPKRDCSEKQQQILECENIGSPRIILKIAKSALAECSEPRSPKSPKIRSATNSPNPEEASSHKLGKIKLKLSKGGHPSIIPNSNDNYEETTAQWHTDNTSSEKPLGMKIKLTKTTESDKQDEIQKHEETKEKSTIKEEGRKTEALKIKLLKGGDASIVQQDHSSKENSQESKHKDNKDIIQETSSSKKQESPPIGMKIKLSKTGDATIIQQDKPSSENVDENVDTTKRTDTPSIGMKIKLSKSGDASVISNEPLESTKEVIEIEESFKRTDSPIGVKIKLAKTKDGSASILTSETINESKEKSETDVSESQELIKGKVSKICLEGDASIVSEDNAKCSIGMKIKLSKTGDASVVSSKEEETFVDVAPAIGMKIKLSKTGDPSIIHPEMTKETEDGMCPIKTKLKNKDHGCTAQQKTKDDTHIEMKIKLSKTGHPTIISSNESLEDSVKVPSITASQSLKHKDLLSFKESTLKVLKKSHSEVSIETLKNKTAEGTMSDLHHKRKEITVAPLDVKKPKLEPCLNQTLPDITIKPVGSAAKMEQQKQKLLLETKTGNISQQQMNVINQEISITPVSSVPSSGTILGDHYKTLLNSRNEQSSSLNSDCEIIEPHPEFIIVNENSNSSQDIMIIDEVPPQPAVKIPKKRGRPRRNPNLANVVHTVTNSFQHLDPLRDPLSLDNLPGKSRDTSTPGEGSERPRRTCRSQKSYAPPKRGRGRGRGKRKIEPVDIPTKKPRVEQDLTAIEKSTTAVITLKKLPIGTPCTVTNSPELYKALNQPSLPASIEILEGLKEPKNEFIQFPNKEGKAKVSQKTKVRKEIQGTSEDLMGAESGIVNDENLATCSVSRKVRESEMAADKSLSTSNEDIEYLIDKSDPVIIKITEDEDKHTDVETESIDATKDLSIQDNRNWLAPSVPKVVSDSTRSDSITALTVIDEDTRMSAESGSRSQTPARNVIVSGTSETLLNEESQGSVHSSATTESERVKVQKNRRMEINFDPDEGPFTVDKVAEYEWPRGEARPPNVRGETYMIQEQISHYLGVKSFKRKYPDLKRRMVDMEERNFLRENGLVSESMCDMGLTAVSSSEVLDIMCNDFPEQYEEYRKYLREKVAKEHSKKQKELTAAANAERNRIDLAEMAMQSALSWNANFNKTRKESRNSSLDLQTFTVQVPKRQQKIDTSRKANYYPVALLPEQYTDYYKAYTPAELRYFPLNTVLYGPMLPNERKFYSQSEVSQSDSDSDSSSDDSSSSSSEGTQDTEGSQSTMDEVDIELSLQSNLKCKICHNNLNKKDRPEVLVQCGTCNGNVHPSCMDLTVDMVPHIRAYAWQCTDCKTCAQCHDPADEDKMLFCDMCDRGYHIYCVGLRRVPQGRWHCQECAVCANCGSKEPGGVNSDRNSVAQWQHEYKKAEKNTRVYVSTFCVPCSKLWRKGRYCPHCSRCHNVPRLDLEPNLVHCGACDKYLHLGCVEAKELIIDKKHYLCEFCSPNRQQFVKPFISKTFKT